jgi:hypothetical protein
MSGSSGGRADKLGNRYEGLWVAYNLLRLLREEVAGVQLEALGDDERGIDLWVTQRDGTRHAQQCKRKNRTVGKWGIGELTRQGVLTNLADQLRRNPSACFTFVSAHPVPELRELCDTARAAGGDAEAYFRDTLSVTSHAESLRRFCQVVGASHVEPEGRRRAFDLLRRTYTHLFEDSPEGRVWVTVLARCLITGDPLTAVEVLANFAQDELGEVITVDQVRRHLHDRWLPPAHLAGNPQVARQIERLREEFKESLTPTLIHSALVPRPEAAAVLDLLTSQAERRLVVLHGRAGKGKSCVLLQLTQLLEEAGVPYLPLRLDRRTPQTSSRRYGMDGCGLPESPAVVLHSLNPGRRTVLIIDQLDAVRWTAAHASAPWEACREVIDDALGLPDVAVVVACRTFDLRDDQQIQSWHAARKGHEVAVEDLPDEAVAAAVTAAGRSYAELTARHKALLRSPLHLALWTEVVRAGGVTDRWGTQADLLREFWRTRLEGAVRMGVPAAETRDAVSALVAEMDRRGELTAPARTLDPYPRAARALKSLHVVVEADRRVTFAHQTYFEYQLATRLLDQARDGGQSVVDWVRDGDQTLLRREQLRLALTLLRDEDPDEHLRTMRGLFLASAGEIRFHLRQLALRLLGESPAPTTPECDLVYELANLPAWREHVLDQVFTRQAAWFAAMDDRGLWAGWLASSNEDLVQSALQMCGGWSGLCGNRVAALIAPYADRPDPWPRWVVGTFPFNPADDTAELFRLRLRLLRRGIVRHRFPMAKEVAERRPERLIDLLEAHFDRQHAEPDDPGSSPSNERAFPYFVQPHEVEHLERVADALPRPFWERLIPHAIRTCEVTRKDQESQPTTPFFQDLTWCPGRNEFLHDPHVELLKIVARAGALVVTEDPVSFASEHAGCLNHPGLSIQYTAGLALADAGEAAADVAVGWLCDNPRRLSLPDDRGHRWGIAQRILCRHAAACSPAAYARLERAILHYHEPDERRSAEWHLRYIREGLLSGPNDYGLAQHALLPCLPADRLSVTARSEMGVLDRKFRRTAAQLRPITLGRRTRVEAFPPDHVARISDRVWLQIIGGGARAKARRQRRVDASVAEATADRFARLLGVQAGWQPGRFAKLALAIPDGADPAYVSAVLHGLVATSPPTADCIDWSPATDEQVAAVIERVGYRNDPQVGQAMCWLMRQRPEALSSPLCLEILCRYANDHPHPAPGWTLSPGHDADLFAAAINCIRGAALGALPRYCSRSRTALMRSPVRYREPPQTLTLRSASRLSRRACRC